MKEALRYGDETVSKAGRGDAQQNWMITSSWSGTRAKEIGSMRKLETGEACGLMVKGQRTGTTRPGSQRCDDSIGE